ncbi:MAG: pyruvate, phosphate dikinase [Elusimicrobia bacterium]|nr:pyruvate, phosphate dikinase [Elusimicrobiota bacterium]
MTRATLDKSAGVEGNLKTKKHVYFFGGGVAEGSASLKGLLGGKGANLHEMTKLGLPVPPGFTISTEVCAYYYQHSRNYPVRLKDEVALALRKLEAAMAAKFGDNQIPLLVSVRSGARASMPGMMDTILNLGLNDATVRALATQAKDERFVWDSYRRFIAMYGEIVLGIEAGLFEQALEDKKTQAGIKADSEIDASSLQALVKEYKALIETKTGKVFPQNLMEQLWGAIGAVFGSWMNARAKSYRELHGIPESWGTAVNIQAMVFGNWGSTSATGVAFTRDPGTGEKKFFGEFLVNAQGEDVVAGTRTPQPVNEESKNEANKNQPTLKELFPKSYEELVGIAVRLEKRFKDMQDIEFTIQKGRLFILQCRNGKRTARAALKIVVDMVKERLIDQKIAISRLKPQELERLLHPVLDPQAKRDVVGRGLAASPGAASGQVVFDPETAERWVADKKTKVILVRVETSPEDIRGMHASEGILTARGGMTSHAAVVARGMGKCCVAGCEKLGVSYERKEMTLGGRVFKEGDAITLDGSTGEVMAGIVPTIRAGESKDLIELMTWADQRRRLGVRANADTPADARVARQFGAEGIGLCRTEHMFFNGERIKSVRKMILAESREEREGALAEIFPMQKQDFAGILREMQGFPVTIRLLDPPLHEFLPHEKAEQEELARELGVSLEKVKQRVEGLKEFNPMLGFRGGRLGVVYPEIYIMQTRAIVEAACELAKAKVEVLPEIMIPLIGEARELKMIREYVQAECERVLKNRGVRVNYKIGTMIEVPRAALTADEIAAEAEFFSFGTNDLTQMGLGLSRDDANRFLPAYVEKKIYPADPFVSIDEAGVGKLIQMAVYLGRKTKTKLKIGICGEHGGDPQSVIFCHKAGLDYVSASPYRVPVARLAAAQAARVVKVKSC